MHSDVHCMQHAVYINRFVLGTKVIQHQTIVIVLTNQSYQKPDLKSFYEFL